MCLPVRSESQREARNIQLINLNNSIFRYDQHVHFLERIRGPYGDDDEIGEKMSFPSGNSRGFVREIHMRISLLLHANKCILNSVRRETCAVIRCERARILVKHLVTCRAGKNCTYYDCIPSMQVLWHYKVCKDVFCRVCIPLREKQNGKA